MILTSLRCYLNHLCQITPAETLLNSSYYILDIADPLYETNMAFDDKGKPCFQNGLFKEPKPRTKKMNENFHITYCDSALNPYQFTSNIMTVNGREPSLHDKQEMYIKHLKNPKVLLKVYKEFFNRECGDMPRILIMFDEELILAFGYVIAEYLSQTFGEDVLYVDPTLRPNVYGHRDGVYTGNKENASKFIRFCKDEKLRKDIEDYLTNTGYEDCIANLSALFVKYPCKDLFDIYERYFPDFPLEPGNYTHEEIIDILIHRIIHGRKFDNISYEDINPNIGTYEANLAEFEKMANENISELVDYTDLPF